MQYTLKDLEGDTIIVIPHESEGVSPKVALIFVDAEDGEMVMLLDDRLTGDLVTAMRMALAESERKG